MKYEMYTVGTLKKAKCTCVLEVAFRAGSLLTVRAPYLTDCSQVMFQMGFRCFHCWTELAMWHTHILQQLVEVDIHDPLE